MLDQARLIIVGGAGYIGRALSSYCRKQGTIPIIFDLGLFGDPHPSLQYIRGSCFDWDLLKATIKEGDIVIHLAGISNDPGYDKSLDTSLLYDVKNFDRYLKILADQRIRGLVFASSCSVYGEQDEGWVDESTSLKPLTQYARDKALSEEILAKYQDRVNIQILRAATVYGRSERMRFDLTFNRFMQEAAQGRAIQVLGPHRFRPSVNIEDLSRFYFILQRHLATLKSGSIWNFAFENRTLIESALIVQKHFRAPEPFIDGGIDQRSYRVNSHKVQNYFKFQPDFDLHRACVEFGSFPEDYRTVNKFVYQEILEHRSKSQSGSVARKF